MINVSENIKKAYDKSTTQIDMIKIDEKEYRIANVEYYDSVYEEGNVFGTAISKVIEFEVISDINLEGREIEYLTGIYIDDTINWISLGNFIITESESDDTTGISKIVAMDYMLKSNVVYESKLDYEDGKVTILDVLNEACENAELILATNDFPNKDFIVDSNQFEENALIRQVFKAIAQISGTIAKIKNDNKLYFVNPNSEETVKKVFELSDYSRAEIKRKTHPINVVSLGMTNIEGENIVLRDEESISKNGENILSINDNPFAYTQKKREQLITALFNAVKGFEYKAFSFECQGLPYLETSDKIQFKDKSGNLYDSFVFRFNHKSPNGLESEIEAPSIIKAEVNYQNVPDALDIARRTEYLVNKQEGYIQQVVEQTEENSKKITEGFQNIDEIRNSVSAIYDFTKTVSGKNQIKIENALDTNIIRLKIKPISNLKGLYPSKKLFPSKRLFPKSATSALTIVVSQKSKGISKSKFFPGKTLFPGKKLFPVGSNERKEFKFNLINPLKIYNNITDEFVIEFDNKKGTCIAKILRRIEKKGNIVTVYNSPKEELIKELDVELFKNQNYIFIKEFENFEFEATYLFNSELNKYYSTKVEANSRIQQKANELTLMVQEETDTDKLIAKINLKPGQIDMTGLVTANENFKILEDGSMEAKNGSFSGNIFLDDGSEIVGGKGLLSNLQFSSDGNSLVSKVGSYNRIGFSNDDMYQRNVKESLFIDVFIPENFTIVSAYLTLSIFPLRILNNGQEQGYGFAKKIKLYKSDMFGNMYADWNVGSGFRVETNENYIELKNALTDGSYTPDLNKKELQTIKSIDIGKNLNLGNSRLKIETANSTPPYNQDYIQNQMNCDFESCFASAKLNVIGYIKNEGGQEKWN